MQMLYMQCLTEAQKMMVIDARGKLVYATSTLAAMLGTKVASLTKMTLPQLIPAPSAQLHAAWMKVRLATGLSLSLPAQGMCAGRLTCMHSTEHRLTLECLLAITGRQLALCMLRLQPVA